MKTTDSFDPWFPRTSPYSNLVWGRVDLRPGGRHHRRRPPGPPAQTRPAPGPAAEQDERAGPLVATAGRVAVRRPRWSSASRSPPGVDQGCRPIDEGGGDRVVAAATRARRSRRWSRRPGEHGGLGPQRGVPGTPQAGVPGGEVFRWGGQQVRQPGREVHGAEQQRVEELAEVDRRDRAARREDGCNDVQPSGPCVVVAAQPDIVAAA